VEELEQMDSFIETNFMKKMFKKNKIHEQEVVIIPFNDSKVHWNLIVVVNPNMLVKSNNQS